MLVRIFLNTGETSCLVQSDCPILSYEMLEIFKLASGFYWLP